MSAFSLTTSLLAYGLVMAIAYWCLTMLYHRHTAFDERIAELRAERGGLSKRPLRNQNSVQNGVPRRPARKKPLMESRPSFQQYQMRLVHAGIYHPHALQLFLSAKVALTIVPIVVGLVAALYGLCTVT
jgi:hypothetical protein